MVDFRTGSAKKVAFFSTGWLEIKADRLLRWCSERRNEILVGSISILAVLLGMSLGNLYFSDLIPAWLAKQVDLEGSANLAAVYAAAIGILSSLIACLRSAQSRRWERLRWALLGVGCAGYALSDLLLVHPGGVFFLVLAAFITAIFFGLLYRHLPGNRIAIAAFWLVVIIAVFNPLLDRYEVALSGNPKNYELVSPTEPYAMTASAWRRLSFVQQVQEGSEMLLVLVVMQLFLFDRNTFPEK